MGARPDTNVMTDMAALADVIARALITTTIPTTTTLGGTGRTGAG